MKKEFPSERHGEDVWDVKTPEGQVEFNSPFGFLRILNTDSSSVIEDLELHDSDIDTRKLLDVYSFLLHPDFLHGRVKVLFDEYKNKRPYTLEVQLFLPISASDDETFPSIKMKTKSGEYQSDFMYLFANDDTKEIKLGTDEWMSDTEDRAFDGFTAREIQSTQFTIFPHGDKI